MSMLKKIAGFICYFLSFVCFISAIKVLLDFQEVEGTSSYQTGFVIGTIMIPVFFGVAGRWLLRSS